MVATSWTLGGLLVFGLCDVLALDLLVAPRALEAPAERGGPATDTAPPPREVAVKREAPVVAVAVDPAAAPVAAAPVAAAPVAAPPAPASGAGAAAVAQDVVAAVAAPTPAAEAPAPVAAPVPVATIDRTPVVLHFASDRATLSSDSSAQLDALVARLDLDTADAIEIIGHADDRGSERYNDELSARRMHRVRDYLAAHGVAPARMTGRAAGEHEPAEAGEGPDALAANRRVEIRVQDPEGSAR